MRRQVYKKKDGLLFTSYCNIKDTISEAPATKYRLQNQSQ